MGSNISYGVNFNNFPSTFFRITEPYVANNVGLYFSTDGTGGTQVPVVTWDKGTSQRVNYETYKSLVIDDIEKLMLSL